MLRILLQKVVVGFSIALSSGIALGQHEPPNQPEQTKATSLLAQGDAGNAVIPAYQGRTAEDWANMLLNPEKDVRMQAFKALTQPDESGGPVLSILLRHPHVLIRTIASTGLEHIAPRYPASIPYLAVAATDNNLNIRYWALSALSKYGAASRIAVKPLIQALDTHEGQGAALDGPSRYYVDARERAATALGNIGIEAEEALPALMKALNDPSPSVREAAQRAIKKIRK